MNLQGNISLWQSIFITLFSMSVVFIVLIIISYILDGFKLFFNEKDPITIGKPIGGGRNIDADEEIVAVIASAIASYENDNFKDLNIKNIREVP